MLLEQAPTGQRVTAIRLTPGNSPLILGYAELGQRPGAGAAAAKHLRVRLDKNGWWIANISQNRRVDAPTATHPTRYLKRWKLVTGDRINLDGVTITIPEATNERLKLQGPQGAAVWENGSLQQEQPAFADCPHEGAAWWLRYLYRHRELRLFTIGGQVPCPRRWHVANIPVKGAEILWQDGQFWLAPGNAKAIRFARSPLVGEGWEGGKWHNAADLEVRLDDPLDSTTKIVLGRTHYDLILTENTLTLTPTVGGDIWHIASTEETSKLSTLQDPRVQITLQPVNLAIGIWNPWQWLSHQWYWILTAIALGIVGNKIILHQHTANHSQLLRVLSLVTIIPALIFGSLTITTIWSEPIPLSLLLLDLGLAWGMGTLLLFITGRLRASAGLLWIAAIGLILFGGLIQAQLGLGGNSERWINFAVNHLRVLTIIGWFILPLILIPVTTLEQIAIALIDPSGSMWWKWLRLSLPWIAALILLLQLSFGGEEGLGNTQPVEGIKTLSALLIAYGGVKLWARRWGLSQFHHINTWMSIAELTWGIVLFLIFAFLLLIAVRDLSPLLLLVLLMLPTLWRIAAHPRQVYSHGTLILRAILSITVLILIGSLIWIKLYPQTLPHSVFQYDRLMVWAQPAQFVESGYQVHRAINFAAQGINGLATGPFGWNGEVMTLPVIQNDFIGAFLLNRFGKSGGIVLLFLQLIYVGALLAISHEVEVWGQQGNAPRQAAGVFLSLSLFALAWAFFAHSIIAWGNVLGLLPVMGQPMTFIAAGTSHLLLFAMPVLILGLMTGWLMQNSEV